MGATFYWETNPSGQIKLAGRAVAKRTADWKDLLLSFPLRLMVQEVNYKFSDHDFFIRRNYASGHFGILG